MTRALSRVGGVIAALTIAVAGLTACGDSDKKDSGPAAAPSSDASFPRTVKHAMGDTEIKERPKRVVALDQSFVDAALALGTEVVGYTTFTAKDSGLPAYLGAAPLADKTLIAKATSVGLLEAPKSEKIVALKPDLILSAKVRHEQGYAQLAKVAPTVFSETTGATWKDNLRLVGRALGKEQLAETRIKEFESRAGKIGEAIKAKNGGKAPTVSVVRFAGEPTVRLYTPSSYIGIIAKDAGLTGRPGAPTGKDISVDVSAERILDLDADHLFVTSYGDASAKQRTTFSANPLWGKLKGAKHDVSDETWMTAVGILGAHSVLDDLAKTFGVDPSKTA